MITINFISTNPFYKDILELIYKYGEKQINDIYYLDEFKVRSYRYREEGEFKGKVLVPGEIDIKIEYKDQVINCKHESIKGSITHLHTPTFFMSHR